MHVVTLKVNTLCILHTRFHRTFNEFQLQKMAWSKRLSLLLILFVKTNSSEFKNCDKNHSKLQICSTKEVYTPPVPVNVDTTLYLNNIHMLDFENNAISLSAELVATWLDKGVELSHPTE